MLTGYTENKTENKKDIVSVLCNMHIDHQNDISSHLVFLTVWKEGSSRACSIAINRRNNNKDQSSYLQNMDTIYCVICHKPI